MNDPLPNYPTPFEYTVRIKSPEEVAAILTFFNDFNNGHVRKRMVAGIKKQGLDPNPVVVDVLVGAFFSMMFPLYSAVDDFNEATISQLTEDSNG